MAGNTQQASMDISRLQQSLTDDILGSFSALSMSGGVSEAVRTAEQIDLSASLAQMAMSLRALGTEDAAHLASQLESMAQSGADAQLVQGAAQALLAEANALIATSGGMGSQKLLLHASLAEEAFEAERKKLDTIASSLFGEDFQQQLGDIMEQAGEDLHTEYRDATDQALDRLAEIRDRLDDPTVTEEDKIKLLREQHHLLQSYAAQVDDFLDRAEAHGIEVPQSLRDELAAQQTALAASELSEQVKSAREETVTEQTAIVAAQYSDEQAQEAAATHGVRRDRLEATNEQASVEAEVMAVVEEANLIQDQTAEAPAIEASTDDIGLTDLGSLLPAPAAFAAAPAERSSELG